MYCMAHLIAYDDHESIRIGDGFAECSMKFYKVVLLKRVVPKQVVGKASRLEGGPLEASRLVARPVIASGPAGGPSQRAVGSAGRNESCRGMANRCFLGPSSFDLDLPLSKFPFGEFFLPYIFVLLGWYSGTGMWICKKERKM